MKLKFLKDIIGWDIINWGESLKIFEKNVDFSKIKNALELGSGNFGGYSLYFSSKNIKTICSNPEGDFKNAKTIHKKYSHTKNISYQTK